MPGNKEHFNAYKKLKWPVLIIALAVAKFGWWQLSLMILFSYFVLARYIDADLDQVSMTGSEGRAWRELGIFGLFFNQYSLAYVWTMARIQKLFGITKLHQSKLTHSFWGTLIRILVFNIPLVGAFYWAHYTIWLLYGFYIVNVTWIHLAWWFGSQILVLGLNDAVHVQMDRAVENKRINKKSPSRRTKHSGSNKKRRR